MIACVKGKVFEKEANAVIVMCGSIGYRLFVSFQTLSKLEKDKEYLFYTHHFVKEDRNELYGFLEKKELFLFQKLISIGGIGPKTALAILSPFSVDKVENAILEGNTNFLVKIPGIGKKTAQRIILELKGQLVKDESERVDIPDEVYQILLNLGYKRKEIDRVLKDISQSDLDTKSVEDILKLCFERLSPI
ncbi:Holliday junction DNA helicase RuvA [Thermotomaculum hydrothermale]|uniref:Holliday junction branch migration complex subunit RuvA n=1 Tax=Thermotomaculum hydrothermale TaxID=981385 RepID=A0A7R6SYB1_9BACT|nr:Holliday junction branch migration protein RuvA [Thermotomaculum hydrothermale]BBB32371.1 Holliday junction DNA helicase RuvA [Thermotomaculum hydrothermale]